MSLYADSLKLHGVLEIAWKLLTLDTWSLGEKLVTLVYTVTPILSRTHQLQLYFHDISSYHHVCCLPSGKLT